MKLGSKQNKTKPNLRPATISLLIQIMLCELLSELSLLNSLRLINTIWVSSDKAIQFWIELYSSH